jgi:hypothetical protein
MTTTTEKKHYKLGFDGEVSGQFLASFGERKGNALVGLAGSLIDSELNEISNFKAYLKVPEDCEWEERKGYRAWSYNTDLKNLVEKEGRDPKEVMTEFVTWLNHIDSTYGINNIDVCSDNPGFDFAWIDLWICKFTSRPPVYQGFKGDFEKSGEYDFGFRRIWCTNSAYHGALLEKTGEFHKWNLEDKLDVNNEKWKNDHDPLNDARTIVANSWKFENREIGKKEKRLTDESVSNKEMKSNQFLLRKHHVNTPCEPNIVGLYSTKEKALFSFMRFSNRITRSGPPTWIGEILEMETDGDILTIHVIDVDEENSKKLTLIESE